MYFSVCVYQDWLVNKPHHQTTSPLRNGERNTLGRALLELKLSLGAVLWQELWELQTPTSWLWGGFKNFSHFPPRSYRKKNLLYTYSVPEFLLDISIFLSGFTKLDMQDEMIYFGRWVDTPYKPGGCGSKESWWCFSFENRFILHKELSLALSHWLHT